MHIQLFIDYNFHDTFKFLYIKTSLTNHSVLSTFYVQQHLRPSYSVLSPFYILKPTGNKNRALSPLYIVINIWHNHSVLSQLYILNFPWRKHRILTHFYLLQSLWTTVKFNPFIQYNFPDINSAFQILYTTTSMSQTECLSLFIHYKNLT